MIGEGNVVSFERARVVESLRPGSAATAAARGRAVKALLAGGDFLLLTRAPGAVEFACLSECSDDARPHVVRGLRAALAFLELLDQGEAI